MNTNIIVQLASDGQPVSLSTGVPLLLGRPGPLTSIKVQSACYGRFEFPIVTPEPGIHDPSWKRTYHRKPHRGDAEPFERDWGEPRASIPFQNLSSIDWLWKWDPAFGTHVLMDHDTRTLVRVSPIDNDVKGPLWHLIYEMIEHPAEMLFSKADKERIVDSDLHHSWGLWCQYACAVGGIYVCLHPAPRPKNQPTGWAFDGKTAIRIDHPSPGVWSKEFEDAIDREQEYGRALAEA